MRYLISIILVLAVAFNVCAKSSPISGKELYSLPEYSKFDISPDGKFVSAHYKKDDHNRLTLIDVATSSILTEINLGLDTHLVHYEWLNDTQLYLTVKFENDSKIIISTLKNGKVSNKITKTEGYLVNSLIEQPNKVLFAMRLSNYKYDLYEISVDDLSANRFDDAKQIKHNERDVSLYFYDELSGAITTSSYDRKSRKVIVKELNTDSGYWKVILKRKVQNSFFRVVALLGKEHLAVLSNEQTDKVALYKYNINSQSVESIIYQHPNYDLSGAVFNKSGQLEYVTYDEAGLSRATYFNPVSKSLAERLDKTFPKKEYFAVAKDRLGEKMIIEVSGADDAGEYLLFDNKQQKLQRLLVAYPELTDEVFYPSQVLTHKTDDGSTLESFLTMPNKALDTSTLLVMPHGGPIGVKDDDRFNRQVQYFASRGFAVLRTNFRGSFGYGKDFMERGVGEFGKLIEQDISLAVNDVLQKHQFKHMCSMGGSYGGYSAVMLAIKHPELYDCVVGSFGIYDLPLLYNHDQNVVQGDGRKKVERVAGKYDESLYDYSPVYFPEKLKAPILLLAGGEDEVAVFEHTARFEYMLNRIKHPITTYYYEDAGHGHSNLSDFHHEMAFTYDFIMSSLNIKLPNIRDMSEKSIAAFADDYIIIADNYDAKDNGLEKHSLEFYNKAASYEHPRANFNMGANYHRGDEVTKDYQTAITFYQKAADLGYASAHRRLGRMHSQGEYFDIDWAKAKEYFESALNIDPTPKNNMYLARFDCSAPYPHKNLSRCMKLLELERFKKISSDEYKQALFQFRRMAPWIAPSLKASPAHIKIFTDILIEAFNIKQLEATLENDVIGSFNYIEGIGYGNEDEFQPLKLGVDMSYSENENHRYGILFEPDVFGVNRYSDRTGILYKWTKLSQNGETTYPDARMLYGSPKSEWRVLRKLSDFKDAKQMTLELFDLSGNSLKVINFKSESMYNNSIVSD